MRVEMVRWTVFCAVALISSAVVAAAGIVGWVGLVIPHIARYL
ncbi:MAG: iron chelate uptake ABC transporter family permease subunit, partial [Actinomycetota bacterium]